VNERSPQLIDTSEGKYHVGERWSYRTRAGEEASLLMVLKVESSQTHGVIVHVRVDGLRIESPSAPGGLYEAIGHMPFAEAAIDKSVTARVASGVHVAGDDEGYKEWRRGFDAGNAGIFSVTVAVGVNFIAQTLSRSLSQSRKDS
jgi:hypothetical protein